MFHVTKDVWLVNILTCLPFFSVKWMEPAGGSQAALGSIPLKGAINALSRRLTSGE
jgi:hypothetical protein